MMKTFVCAMCILLLLILLIGLNAYYIHTLTDRMLEHIARIPPAGQEDCSEAISTIETLWEKNRKPVGLSAHARTVERIDELILSLKITCREDAYADFEIHRELLRHAVEELRNLERCSIWNIV